MEPSIVLDLAEFGVKDCKLPWKSLVNSQIQGRNGKKVQGANIDVVLTLGDPTYFSHPGTKPFISLDSGLGKSAGDRVYK